MTALAAVPPHVQRAFGLTGRPLALPGGQGTSVRIGAGVLKPAGDVQEAVWSAELMSRVREQGFRVARPLRSEDGAWVVDGWSATSFVEGQAGPGGRWDEVLGAAGAFHTALSEEPCPGFLAGRGHRWAMADRVAWGEQSPDPVPAVRPLLDDLLGQLDAAAPVGVRRLLHGDLAGNVLFAPGLAPAIIDFSPYCRPLDFAAAMIAVDGVLWYDGGPALLERVAGEAGGAPGLLRALVFRLVALNERSRFDPAVLGELPQFAAAASMIGRVAPA